MPLRVLHLSAGNLYGGIERLLTTLAGERSCCPDMEPGVALCFDGKVAAELGREGVPVHLLGEVRFSRVWTVWRARRALRNLLRRERYDVAICHACWPHALFAGVIRAAGVPLVFWAHDVPRMTHWTDRKAAKVRPDLAIANSNYTASQLSTLFPGVRTEVCYAPVSLQSASVGSETRAEVRRELATDPTDIVIVMFSRMEALKGHALLLSALSCLADVPGWTCWIAGGPQRPMEQAYFEETKKLAADSRIAQCVRFLGQRNDIPRLLAAADIHCQPNITPESFGLAFVEALAAGLPVVTTDIGPASEIVTPECGRLVPAGDAAALAQTLRGLMLSRVSALQPAACRQRATELCQPSTRMTQLNVLLHTVSVDRSLLR